MTDRFAYLIDDAELCIGAMVVADGTEPPQPYLTPGRWEFGTAVPIIGGRFEGGETFFSWSQITGTEGGFDVEAKIFHDDHAWVSVVSNNLTEPGVSGWHRFDGAWVQPAGAADAYRRDAVVNHAGHAWANTGPDANTSEPGVSGWVRV